ncbi:ARF GAP-like zinc finger-containing protein [Trichomonas vaginalis G3]|uniref:ARF GAP-like zinc finger-containing protein n=1 Tax=Trichomonas vaginalis (strain ATCC PRA-98 / G3) TaxID=412133 RepID=A2DLY7_TRIV3|nr:GTPase activator protein [Trichomonas vaginalis G3]EAY18590.1 ARF GAP-like zinc finger-containing protein [Trichomonas vaginalis G3]KAI5491618.1 GTPase activator protein [Trichomonas vaginalis G3]|eukprot:XP_001579576.1 ARF GAP-like zinc finger-containing protein [Trichomonas vaginalis G3]
MNASESAEAQKIISMLLDLPENNLCADCHVNPSKWASTNLGIFICIHCSGVHRSLGTHISKVRSCSLDNWSLEQAYVMANVGNKIANEYWEANLPKDFVRPVPTNKMELALFIKRKYDQKLWTKPGIPPHLSIQPKKSLPKQNKRKSSHKRAHSPSNPVIQNQPSFEPINEAEEKPNNSPNLPTRSGSQIIFTTNKDESSSDSIKGILEPPVESIIAKNVIDYIVDQILEPDVKHELNLLKNIIIEEDINIKPNEIQENNNTPDVFDVDDDFFEDHPPKFVDLPKKENKEEKHEEPRHEEVALDVDDDFFDIEVQKPKIIPNPIKKIPNPAKPVPVIEKIPKKLPRPGVIIVDINEKKKKKHHKKKSEKNPEKVEEKIVQKQEPEPTKEQDNQIDEFFEEYEAETKNQKTNKVDIDNFFQEEEKPAKPAKIPSPFKPASLQKGPGTQLPARLQKLVKSREKVVVGERKRRKHHHSE